MQRTCPSCHRSFYIDQDDIRRYDSIKGLAANKMMSTWGKKLDMEYFKEVSEAQTIDAMAKNPYKCPYCGFDTRQSTYSGPMSNDEKWQWYNIAFGIFAYMWIFIIAFVSLESSSSSNFYFWLIINNTIFFCWPFYNFFFIDYEFEREFEMYYRISLYCVVIFSLLIQNSIILIILLILRKIIFKKDGLMKQKFGKNKA